MTIAVRAIANGDYHTGSTWNTGAVPPNGATVYLNGFNITFSQSILIGGANNPQVNATAIVAGCYYWIQSVGTTSWTSLGAPSGFTAGIIFLATANGTGSSGTGVARAVGTITNLANGSAGASAGGNLTKASGVSEINCYVDLRSGSQNLLFMADGICNIDGTSSYSSLYRINIIANSALCIVNNGASINKTAVYTAGGSGSGTAIQVNSGSVSATLCTFDHGGVPALNLTSGTSALINNCIIDPTRALSNGGAVVTIQSGASLQINNSSILGYSLWANPSGIFCSGSITGSGNTFNGNLALQFSGSNYSCNLTNNTAIAGSLAPAIIGPFLTTPPLITISGTELDSSSGYKAILVSRYNLGPVSTSSGFTIRRSLNGTSTFSTFYLPDHPQLGNPSTSDVRLGTTYGPASSLTGTLNVPPAVSVAAGVPVDNTIGTAAISETALVAAIRADLERVGGTLNTRSTLTASQVRDELSPELQRIANCATVDSTGAQIVAAFPNQL